MNKTTIFNPQYDGSSFFWEGGPVGVLLMHGLTATVQEVRLLAQQLHTRGYTVAGPLLPGHYTCPEDLNRARWQDWVSASESMYQKIHSCCPTVFVGGESAGALVALFLASQHPEIAGILTYAPALRLNLRSYEKILLPLLSLFIPSVPKASLDASEQWQGYPVNPLKAARQLICLQHEIDQRLPDIRQPILIVHGRLDTTVHPSVPDTIQNKIGSEIKEKYWMENSSHCVLLDQELDQVTELTISFMNRVLQTSSTHQEVVPLKT